MTSTDHLDAPTFLRALCHDPAAAFDAQAARIPEVAAMRECPQPANHHSEGSVWDHTRLALQMLADLPAHIERYAGTALRAAGRWPLELPARTLTQAMAVLLHDVGKPVTRQGPDGAWTYHGHDRVGATMAVDILARHGLVDAAQALGVQLAPDRVAWLVDNHLFWLNTEVAQVTDRAVARRFVDDPGRGDDLRVLSWCDTLGSRGPDGRPHVDLLVAAEDRLARTRERAATPPPRRPLDGRTIMRELDLEPGPRVGAVLDWLARRDLHGDAAVAALRRERDHLRHAAL